MLKIRQFYGLLGLIAFLFAACSGDDPRNDFSVSDIPQQTSLRRFEQDMLAIGASDAQQAIAGLKQKYRDFWTFYTQDIMQWPDSLIRDNILKLNTSPIVKDLMDTIDMVFGDFSREEEILENGFRRFHHHFPLAPTPDIITTITEFHYPTATDDSLLVLSLEMFLGEDYPYYPGFGLPEYKIRRMNKWHLPVFAMNAWYDQQLSGLTPGKRLIDAMISEGKRLYFMDLMYPDMPDSLKTYWTAEQLDWLKDSEAQSWTYYIEKELLYSKDVLDYSNLLADAPFTSAPDVPTDSAPRIAAYTGWQIIKKYMAENPGIGLQDLMFNPDVDGILKDAGYRPK